MKKKKMYYVIPAILLIAVMMGFASIQPVNSLTMDVNPSIEIVTSRLNRVIEVKALNEDAKELLEDFQVKDKNLEKTVNDLVDLMILTGHIKGGNDNFLMLTVEDHTVDSKLVDRVNRAIEAMLENKQIEATILNQIISKEEKEEEKTGVQLAAERLYQIEDDLTIEEIGNMTVREFINYSKKVNIPIEKLFSVISGDIKKLEKPKTIISIEKAKEIALEVVNGKIIKIELDNLDDDDGPEYEIEILGENAEYEIEIDAYTGQVKKFKKDYHDYEDKEEKNSTEKPENSTKKRISQDQAKKIAFELTGGGTITDFESDDDEYEIEIRNKGYEYEIEIDAYSGEILDFEKEKEDN